MATKPMRKWLLLFNCQAGGLASCLESLSTDLSVDTGIISLARKDPDALHARLRDVELVITTPSGSDLVKDGPAPVFELPPVFFRGFHPDLVHLGPGAKGPLGGGFHSVIAHAAWTCGMDEARTATLYTDEVFARLGYLDAWGLARDWMVDQYATAGIDLRPAFVAWSRQGAFMHSPNHPAIHVLHDIARLVLRRLDVEVRESGIVPHDNLVNGPVFAVYPRIAANVGVAGSYFFKPGASYRLMRLPQFIAASFRAFRDADGLVAENATFAQQVKDTLTFMEALR